MKNIIIITTEKIGIETMKAKIFRSRLSSIVITLIGNHESDVSQVLHTAFLKVVRPHQTQPAKDVVSVGLTSL